MEAKRKRYKADFKFKVALEAAKDQKTLSQLSSQYGVHAGQVGQWKKQLLTQGPEVFAKDERGVKEDSQELLGRLYQQIGQLQVELDWLKKKSGQF
ncbi:transposase [soil metagenome]